MIDKIKSLLARALSMCGAVLKPVLWVLSKLRTLTPRTWLIWLVAAVTIKYLLPHFELKLVIRFVTLFSLFCGAGWAALRVFWTKRSKDIETGEYVHDEIRAMVRDFSYAIMVTGALVGASNLSL